MIEKVEILGISAVIPTAGRKARLVETIRSILSQESLPIEIVIVDGSDLPWVQAELEEATGRPASRGVTLTVATAEICGAGAQRNQGVSLASQPFIWFLDDDIDLEPSCLASIWTAMQEDEKLGGCNAVITNQNYHPPGRIMRWLLGWTGCPTTGSLAGRCIGPALNFLPTLSSDNAEGTVEWLNLGCTLYRRIALPSPPFLAFFEGYSLMEDATLSLEVGKQWRLRSLAHAKIYHDSQPANYKSHEVRRQAMDVTNRWFVVSRILERRTFHSFLQLLAFQCIGLVAILVKPVQWLRIPGWFAGTCLGFSRIARDSSSWRGYSLPPSSASREAAPWTEN